MDASAHNKGLPAYQGYEYQIQVTIWVALHLLLRSEGVCNQLEVEPASEEDIRATLDVDAEKPLTTLRLPARRELQIQIKQRSKPFSASDFKQLVSPSHPTRNKKGPAPRARPIDYLLGAEAPGYVLITTAQVDTKLVPHVIHRLDERPAASTLPFSAPSKLKLSKEEQAELASRLGIIHQQTPTVMDSETRRLLREVAHVPSGQLDRCIRALQDRVRDHLLGRTPSKMWTRAELHRTLRECGGLAQHPHEKFIQPGNYEQLRGQLEWKSALVLTGSPGVGKTMTAEVLAYEHQVESDPFEIVREELTPSKIRSYFARPGRHLFYLEDPWGAASTRSPDAALWTKELPRLLGEASSDKRFLVTSRAGFLKDAWPHGLPDSLRELTIELLPQHYSSENRWEILSQVLHGRPVQEDLAIAHREQILSVLEVPYSLHLFGRKLQKKSSLSENELDTLLHGCLMEALGHVVAEELRSLPGEQMQAAMLAGFLFQVRSRFNEEDVDQMVRALRGTPLQHIEFKATLEHLVRAGWVEARNNEYWAHPQVIDGLTLLFDLAPERATATLMVWLKGLLEEGYVRRALLLSFQLDKRKQSLPQEVRDDLDALLIENVQVAEDADFFDAVQLLGHFSRSSAPEAIVARRLIGPEGFPRGDGRWWPRDWSPVEREALQASASARELVARFIRLGWVSSKNEYLWFRFSALTRELGWSFHDEFDQTARAVLEEAGWRFLQTVGKTWDEVDNPFTLATTQLLEGALDRPEPPFEDFLQLALDRLAQVRKVIAEEKRELRKKFLPGGFEMLMGNMRLNTLKVFERALETIVDIRRQREGYEWIRTHPRRAEIVPAFGASIRAVEFPSISSLPTHSLILRPGATIQELLALHSACDPGDRRPIWHLLVTTKAQELQHLLLEDLRTCPFEHLSFGLTRLEWLLHEPEKIRQALASLSQDLDVVRRLAISEARHKEKSSESYPGLSPEERRILEFCLSAFRTKPTCTELDSVRPEEWEHLRQLAARSQTALGLGARLFLAFSGESSPDLAESINGLSDDVPKLVVLRRIVQEELPAARSLLRTFLRDESSRCRYEALLRLAPMATLEEREDILRLAEDPCAVIQGECAVQIGKHGWPEGVDTLFSLLNSPPGKVTFHSLRHPQASPIARTAAEALARMPRLEQEHLRRCIELIRRGSEAIADPIVRCDLIPIIARSALPEARATLEQCLESPEAVLGEEDSRAFPLRYAGAWGLVAYLKHHPEARGEVNLVSISRAAKHPDARLAGPALVVLGLAAAHSLSAVREVFAAEGTNAHRALLVAAGAFAAGTPLPGDVLRIKLSEREPGLRLLEHVRLAGKPASEELEEFLGRQPEVGAWLSGLREASDTQRVLLWMFFEFFGRRVRESLPLGSLKPGEILTEDASLHLISELEWRGSDPPPHMW